MDEKKFLVVVNHTWIITVSATSMGGAEHRILDNFFGIKQCQAFEPENAPLLFEMFPEVETASMEAIQRHSDIAKAIKAEAEAEKLLAEARELRSKWY